YLAATATLIASGAIQAIVCTDPGNAVTSLPTLTITGGGGSSGAATVIMNWSVTGLAVSVSGAAYGNAQPVLVTTAGGLTAGVATHTSPGQAAIEGSIPHIRPAQLLLTSTAGGLLTGTGTVIDGGIGFQDVPSGIVVAGGSGLATTAGQVTLT